MDICIKIVKQAAGWGAEVERRQAEGCYGAE